MKTLAHALAFTALCSLSACGGGDDGDSNGNSGSSNGSDTVGANAQAPSTCTNGTSTQQVSLEGTVTFDRVHHNPSTNGLDYNNITQDPVRRATIHVLDCDDQVIGSTRTSTGGYYSITAKADATIRLSIRAEMIDPTGQARWAVRVRNNHENNALYVANTAFLNMENMSASYDINLPSGWNGSTLSNQRFAAPFAILDSIYASTVTVINAEPTTTFPPLDVFWSPQNTSTTIGSSHHTNGQLYILGEKNVDADEYDHHVISHEWAHYMEFRLGRTDSIGGPHGAHDKLDKRVAFSEALSNAFSAITTNDPNYRDSKGHNQNTGFSFNVEHNDDNGWFSEASMQSVIYDLYDSQNDGADSVSLGFAPIFRTITSTDYVNQNSRTSIFSFIALLKQQNSSEAAAINTLVNSRGVNASQVTIYGDFETNDAGGDQDALPIYHSLAINGNPIEVCSSDIHGTKNKLGVYQLVRFHVANSGPAQINVTPVSSGSPRWFISRGATTLGGSNAEAAAITLASGSYILDIADSSVALSNNTANRRNCYHVSVTQ